MPEWLSIVAGIAAGFVGGGVAWGALTTRVSRLEKDVEARVTTLLFEAHLKRIEDKLDQLLDRENSGVHNRVT